jgi:hypothetical protein
MEHLMLFCRHTEFLKIRADIIGQLESFSEEVARQVSNAPPCPDFNDNIALYCVLQLCTGVGHTHHRQGDANGNVYRLNVLQPHGIMTRSRAAAVDQQMLQQQRRQIFQLNPDRIRAAATWVSFLTHAWRAFIGNDRANSPAACCGEKLVDIVCRFNQKLFSVRRHLLRNDEHYLTRDRDPPSSRGWHTVS